MRETPAQKIARLEREIALIKTEADKYPLVWKWVDTLNVAENSRRSYASTVTRYLEWAESR
jgi:hypothetical protein